MSRASKMRIMCWSACSAALDKSMAFCSVTPGRPGRPRRFGAMRDLHAARWCLRARAENGYGRVSACLLPALQYALRCVSAMHPTICAAGRSAERISSAGHEDLPVGDERTCGGPTTQHNTNAKASPLKLLFPPQGNENTARAVLSNAMHHEWMLKRGTCLRPARKSTPPSPIATCAHLPPQLRALTTTWLHETVGSGTVFAELSSPVPR